MKLPCMNKRKEFRVHTGSSTYLYSSCRTAYIYVLYVMTSSYDHHTNKQYMCHMSMILKCAAAEQRNKA
jgi:hypothetical protein